MKYIRRTSHDIKDNFLIELLKDRGVLPNEEDKRRDFFYPSFEKNLLSPLNLDHMKEGAELLISHLEKGCRIYLIVDSDCDGYGSAAMFYNYLTEHLSDRYDFTIEYHIPTGKEHGLRTIMDVFEGEKKWDLVVLPDSSSNDYEEHKQLKEMGMDVLILDHHSADSYSEDAIVINNQLSEQYENKELSGVGVVYKFICYLDELFGMNYANDYLDLAAFSEISDMMKMNTIENRLICDFGLSHIKNQFLKELIEKQSYSLGDGPLTQIGVAFYLTPLVNALIRVGSNIEKERLFQAFITPDLEVPSTKRGEKGLTETICTQSVRNCVNAKARQNRETDKAIELLDIQILNNSLNNNKIIILNTDDMDIPSTLTGLCAMRISAKYKKPVMLGRTCPDGYFRGSARGRGETELKDFRQFLLDSNLMEFCQGQLVAHNTFATNQWG